MRVVHTTRMHLKQYRFFTIFFLLALIALMLFALGQT
jgi:hypothetical protein